MYEFELTMKRFTADCGCLIAMRHTMTKEVFVLLFSDDGTAIAIVGPDGKSIHPNTSTFGCLLVEITSNLGECTGGREI